MSIESFIGEAFIYLIVAGTIQALGALLIAPFFFVIARRLTHTSFPNLFGAYFIFNGCLLFWGCLGNYVFMTLTYDRLYSSEDTVVDWFPFIPFGQWVLDQFSGDRRGALLGGTSLWQMRLIWLAVAAPVWLLSYASTRFLLLPDAHVGPSPTPPTTASPS